MFSRRTTARQPSPADRPPLTLSTRECPPAEMSGTRICADFQMTFLAEVEQDVQDARVTATFLRGSQMCAFAVVDNVTVDAGQRKALNTPVVYLSAERDAEAFEIFDLCPMPVTTTEIVVSLVGTSGPMLSQRLWGTYTFAAP